MVLLLIGGRNVVRSAHAFFRGHHGCLLVRAAKSSAKASQGFITAGVVAADVRICSEWTRSPAKTTTTAVSGSLHACNCWSPTSSSTFAFWPCCPTIGTSCCAARPAWSSGWAAGKWHAVGCESSPGVVCSTASGSSRLRNRSKRWRRTKRRDRPPVPSLFSSPGWVGEPLHRAGRAGRPPRAPRCALRRTGLSLMRASPRVDVGRPRTL